LNKGTSLRPLTCLSERAFSARQKDSAASSCARPVSRGSEWRELFPTARELAQKSLQQFPPGFAPISRAALLAAIMVFCLLITIAGCGRPSRVTSLRKLFFLDDSPALCNHLFPDKRIVIMALVLGFLNTIAYSAAPNVGARSPHGWRLPSCRWSIFGWQRRQPHPLSRRVTLVRSRTYVTAFLQMSAESGDSAGPSRMKPQHV
jgi:hypothetical protein